MKSIKFRILYLLNLGLILAVGIPAPIKASTFTVTKTIDTADGACDTDCSLREAIIAANSSAGMDSIVLSNGTYTLDVIGIEEDQAFTGDLDINDSLNITGSGTTTTIIDGNGTDRIFHVDPSGSGLTVNIAELTVQNGIAPYAMDIGNNSGGGIYNRGNLTLTKVIIKNNNALFFGNGGGLFNSGSLLLIDSKVSENTGSFAGGIGNTGTIKQQRSIVSNNISIGSVGSGGGIYNSGTFMLEYSSITGNSAKLGGGINNLGELDIFNSTISGNNASFTLGGGIYNKGILRIINSTISTNTANVSGGGIYNKNLLAMANVTITLNRAMTGQGGGIYSEVAVQIESSILAKNSAVSVSNNCVTENNFTDFGYNIEDANSCAFDGEGDLNSTNPLLGPLQDNGGFTFTHALLNRSPAIDSGNPDNCTCPDGVTILTTDQRGYLRPADGNKDGTAICDIGAFEYDPTKDFKAQTMPWLQLLLE